jgi:hypothetical protein
MPVILELINDALETAMVTYGFEELYIDTGCKVWVIDYYTTTTTTTILRTVAVSKSMLK